MAQNIQKEQKTNYFKPHYSIREIELRTVKAFNDSHRAKCGEFCSNINRFSKIFSFLDLNEYRDSIVQVSINVMNHFLKQNNSKNEIYSDYVMINDLGSYPSINDFKHYGKRVIFSYPKYKKGQSIISFNVYFLTDGNNIYRFHWSLYLNKKKCPVLHADDREILKTSLERYIFSNIPSIKIGSDYSSSNKRNKKNNIPKQEQHNELELDLDDLLSTADPSLKLDDSPKAHFTKFKPRKNSSGGCDFHKQSNSTREKHERTSESYTNETLRTVESNLNSIFNIVQNGAITGSAVLGMVLLGLKIYSEMDSE